MTQFDHFVMVDWSGGNDTGPRPRKDAIWICEAGHSPIYLRNRQLAEAWLDTRMNTAILEEQRLCIGFDFPFGYPQGFAQSTTGTNDPLMLWNWLETQIVDQPKFNNRFDIAGQINAGFPGSGPFWGNALARDVPNLPRTKVGYENPFPDRRAVETLARGSFTCWQLSGAGSVGGQVMMGLPILSRLRRRWPGQVSVWPFEQLDKFVAFVEIWPSLMVGPVPDGWIKDAWQVLNVASDLAAMDSNMLCRLLDVAAPEEGWILGIRQGK